MLIAWTTILVIALLAPGVCFFVGYCARDRYSREVVRSSAVGEVALAVLVAIFLHLSAWFSLSYFWKFDLAFELKVFADYDSSPNWLIIDQVVARSRYVLSYVLATSSAGITLGYVIGWAIVEGWLPFLATHKWLNEVRRAMRKGVVTAYVMTNTIENNNALMYKGVVSEFYLSPDGKFVYLVLRSCSRYFMKFAEDLPKTGAQLELFSGRRSSRTESSWDYLLIDGENIANILFDPSPQIVSSSEGATALESALDDFNRSVDEALRKL